MTTTTRTTYEFELPQPIDEKENNEWVSVPRIARTIPFGYVARPDDPDILDPVPEELDKLEEAKKLLRQYSYRQVAQWLTKKSGRYISHVGLQKRVNNERKRKTKAKRYSKFAEIAEKAAKAAEKLEKERLGARED